MIFFLTKKILFLTLAVFLLTFSSSGFVDAATQTFTSSGTWTSPAGLELFTVECWGGGGGGGGNNDLNSGTHGGGGGAYSKEFFSPAGSTVFTVTVGAGGVGAASGVSATNGGDSWFYLSAVFLAKGGGKSSSIGGAGAGGASGSGLGSIKYSGGNGAASDINGGGGGGSSAGTGANGGNASGQTGGTAPSGGGNGGAGSMSSDGTAGSAPGGGGGGGSGNGGAGAAGKCIVTWTPPTFSISGTVYSDEGTTNIGSAKTVAVSINGAAAAGNADTNGSGAYSITGLTVSAGDVLTLYLDGETEKATTVTVGTGSNLTGINLYQNDLITRQDNSGSLTNTNLDTADNNADADISAIYSVSAGALTVASGKSLYIPASNTFAPGGNVSVGGNFTNAGTYTKGTETLTLTGTGTQTFKTNSSQLYALTINGSGGTYTPQDATTVSNNLIITAGTLSLVGSAFTVSGTTSVSGTISTATSATGTKTFTGAVTVASGGTFDLSSQNPVTSFGAGITQSSSNLMNIGSGASTLVGNFAGAGTGGITFGGTLAISSGTTSNGYTGGTVTVTGTLTLTGNLAQANGSALSLGSTTPFSGAGTFSASTATNTVSYTASGAETIKDPDAGSAHTYSNLSLSGSGAKTMTAITTTNNFTMSGSASTTGNVLTTISGTLTLSGTATLTTGANLAVTSTTTIGDGTTLTLGAFTFTSTGNLTIGGGTSGIFTATSGTAINLVGNLTIGAGATFTKMTSGNFTFKSGNGSQTATDNASGQDLGAVKISVNTTNTTLTPGSSLKATSVTIDSSQTLVPGSNTITLSGTGTIFSNSGAYTAGTSTITISDTSSTSKTFAGGGGTYGNLSITASGTGAVIFTGANTFANFTINSPKTVTLPASTTTTITGTFSCTGTAGNVITINSSSGGTAATLSKASGTVSCDYLSLQDSAATGGATWNPGSHSTNVSGNSGWIFNSAPSITAGPSDGSSSSTTPTNVGSSVTFTATATDADSDQYYLAICKTDSVTAVNSGAPTCGGGNWGISSATASGAQASVSYTTLSGDAESNAWFAFVCDNNTSSSCSSSSQGSGNSGSPFAVNHVPSFSATGNSGSPAKLGATMTFTSTASDTDTDGSADTVQLFICKANDFSAGACGASGEWAHSSASSSDPSATYTILSGDTDGTKTYYASIIDNHSFASSSNPRSSTFVIDKTAPTTTDDYTSDGTWVTTNQTITLTPADATSGVASTKYCTDTINTCDPTAGTSYTTAVTISAETTTYFRYESTDNAGNVQTTVSRSVKIDKTKPTTSDDYSSKDGNWQTTNQTITLTPADATSGVASTKYCTDTINTCDPTAGTSYTTAVTISAETTTYFRYESTDNAGNVQTTVSRSVKIDTVSPTVSAGSNQSKNTQFTQTATVSDATSGINTGTYQWAKVSGSGTITFGTATALSTTISASADASYVISFTVSDDAGNSNSANFTLTWDATSPVLVEVTPVSTPSTNHTPNYVFSSTEAGTITYGGSCSSTTTAAVSGSNTITLSTLSDGTYSNCTITVTDAAANASLVLAVTVFTLTTPSSGFGGSGPTLFSPSRSSDSDPNSSAEISRLMAILASLRAQLQAILSGKVQRFSFTKNLVLGSMDPDVTRLQQFLNSRGFMVALSGPGSPGKETNRFGSATKNALIRFQNANAKEILFPYGLVQGSGFLGLATRQYIDKIYGIE